MPLVGTLLIGLSLFSKTIFVLLLEEDGLLEWMQFFLFCLVTVSGIRIAVLFARTRNYLYAVLFACFALAMLFCAGEEISWGQRVFGIETPEELMTVNKQREITLHNIGESLTGFRLALFLSSMIAILAWPLNRLLHLERRIPSADVLFIPPFFLSASFLVMFVYRGIRYAVPALGGFAVVHLSEWAEFCFAFGLAGYSWLIAKRLKAECSQPQTLDTRGPAMSTSTPALGDEIPL